MSDIVERLAPCPFCGGAAEWHDITEADETANIGGSCIVCTRCQACGPVQFGEKDTIIEQWNRRSDATITALREEVERLTARCSELSRWADGYGKLDADYAAADQELTALTARTREVLAPFAELVPAAFADVWKGDEQVALRTHLQGDVAALRINDFRAANTLFNELKEKDNG